VRFAALLVALAVTPSVPFRQLAQASPPGETPAKPLVALSRYIDYLRPRDASRVRKLPVSRVAVAVFAGVKPTGGYTITVTRVTLAAGRLTVTARVAAPDGPSTQVFTSPYELVTIARPARLPTRWTLRDTAGITVATGAFPP
jgi:hypothetical protein